ncbi:MAG: hypothetical protein WBV82_32850 [Myxococcaceae bacterium]
MNTRILSVALLAMATGCGTELQSTANQATVDHASKPVQESELPFEPLEVSPAAVRVYLSQLAPMLVQRELTEAELSAVEWDGLAAVAPVLEAWTREPGFAEAARMLVSNKLSTGGVKDGIDFELPGNLAAYVAKNDLPLSTLLTAEYCVNAAGEKISCDTGAPFQAGVLTTRAYMKSRVSRFNLTRASTLMSVFACKEYPMSESFQPRLERTLLIPMFQANTVEEQTDPNAGGGFGNGAACYSCHGQFGAHAQLFVRFDSEGVYRPDATGIQDPAAEPGVSSKGLMTSHLQDPVSAASDASQILGESVENLAQAARVLVQSPEFWACQAENLLQYAFGITRANEFDPRVAQEIAEAARRDGTTEPSMGAFAVETFTHPRVIKAVIEGLGAQP